MPKLGLGIGLGSLIGRPSVGGSIVPSFAPTDLPNLELWLDANEGTINTVGNNFTDATRSVELAGFPTSDGVDPNSGTYTVGGPTNGKPNYTGVLTGGDFGGLGYVFWNGSAWQLDVEIFFEEGLNRVLNSTATGDTEYPWQATWANGTVTPTATTFDVPATNNQTVARWVNKVSGKPNLNQTTLAAQPVFKSDVFGRKAVFFDGDALFNSGFSTFFQNYSYYLVSTSLLGALAGTPSSAIRLGTPTASAAFRGLFGARGIAEQQGMVGDPLAVQNSNVVKEVAATRFINNNAGVFSARFDLSAGEVTIGRNLANFLTTANNTSTANTSTILIGAGSTSGATRPTNSNFSEVLVYRAFHNNDTALQVINYLVQKWNINTVL